MSVSDKAFQIACAAKDAEIARLNEWRKKAIAAADDILAPMTAEYGRIMEESPEQEITVTLAEMSVTLTAAKFMALYRATDT